MILIKWTIVERNSL